MASASNQEGPTPDDAAKLKKYSDFMDKVKRTIYLDNLSPQVTESVIKKALGQVGAVVSVKFLENCTIPNSQIPQSALVEMETHRKAQAVIDTLVDFPFMMSAMPRPVRAQPARPEMFVDCPAPPAPTGKRKIEFRVVKPGDKDYEKVKKLKFMAKRHKAEQHALYKHHVEEQEKLAKQHQEVLMGNYKKYGVMEKIMQDGSLPKLAQSYNISLD